MVLLRKWDKVPDNEINRAVRIREQYFKNRTE